MSDENAKAVVDTTGTGQGSTLLKYPGNIPVANDQGSYPGCLAVRFGTLDSFNGHFAKDGPGHRQLCVSATFHADGSVTALVTKTLSEKEQEEFDEFSRDYGEFHAQKEAERNAAKAEVEAEKERVAEENARLIKVGRAYEEKMAKAQKLGNKERGKAVAKLQSGQDEDVSAVVNLEKAAGRTEGETT